MCSALSGVVFCLNFGPCFYSSLVPLRGVFPLFIYLFIFVDAYMVQYTQTKSPLPPSLFSHHQHIKVPYYLPSPPYSSAQVFVVAFMLLTTY